jgi:hypothetical protein
VIFARGPTDNSLLQYAYQRGWDGVRVLSDADVLLRAIRAGRVEVVLANSLSGMARSVPELVAALRELVSRGGALIIPGRGINTSEAPQVFIEMLYRGVHASRCPGGHRGGPVKSEAARSSAWKAKDCPSVS